MLSESCLQRIGINTIVNVLNVCSHVLYLSGRSLVLRPGLALLVLVASGLPSSRITLAVGW